MQELILRRFKITKHKKTGTDFKSWGDAGASPEYNVAPPLTNCVGYTCYNYIFVGYASQNWHDDSEICGIGLMHVSDIGLARLDE